MPRRRSRGELLAPGAAPRQRLDDEFSVMYTELRRLAAFVKRKDANATISTATLVHETWMKLAGSPGATESELHFKRRAACVMRQVATDAARRRHADKRGGGCMFVTLDDSVDVAVSSNEDLLRLDAALDALALMNPRQAEMVVLRFFGGLSNAEIETVLGVGASTVERDWRAAKAWLGAEIRKGC